MKVTILNPEEVGKLFEYWGKASCVCYDTDTETPETVGKHCMNSGHFSGSRGIFILFKVEGCPRFTIDQAVRHEVGVMKNVQSFRYVGKDSFVYEVPTEITDNAELLTKYHNHMMKTMDLYCEIQDYVYNKTNSHERANEQAKQLQSNSYLDSLKKNKNITLLTVEKLCKILDCQPNDIVQFNDF